MRSSCTWEIWFRVQGRASQREEKQILQAFEDVVFHLRIRIASTPPTALCCAGAGHVICQGPPQLAL